MLEDAIKELQNLYKSFKNLECIEVHDYGFTLIINVNELETEERTFNDTVKALKWLEEKHGIKSE